MKVLQVHNFYRTRGGECSVVNTERALLENYGHEVIPYYRDSLNIDELGLLAKAHMLLNVPYNNKVERDLEVIIRNVKPDVAHVHNVFPMLTTAVYKALNRCGVPVVQTIHNFRFLCPNGQFYIHDHICEDCQKRGYFSAVKKRCMQDSILVSSLYAIAISNAWKTGILPNNIDKYIALNQFFAQRLIDAGIPSSRVCILGNFIDETEVSVSAKQDYVLYLGRLSKEKGIRTLLNAWENVSGSTLKIAGSGPMLHEIEALVSHRNVENVQLLGHVSGDEKQELIKNAICLVVPSEWYENFPISIVEAMSLGTPVVASNIGGLPEMVGHKKTGLIFEPGNHDALEAVLYAIITDQEMAGRLAVNALKAAQDLFGASKHHDGLIEIYSEAINDHISG
jgi:glycosyltransferase involved in cell wall biosynthesis